MLVTGPGEGAGVATVVADCDMIESVDGGRTVGEFEVTG